MKKMVGALIGCGAIAREHLSAIARMESVEIGAVCDISSARAEEAAERFGIPRWYTSQQQLLAEMQADLIHVTTPPSTHFSISKDCLNAGFNVLCEKPITTNYQEFQILKRLAVEKNCLFIENQNFRFHSSIQRINKLIGSGKLGDILDVQICLSLNVFGRDSPYIDPNAAHSGLVLRGGVVGDFLTHIGYLAFLFIGPIRGVRTVWSKHRSDSPLPADEFRGLIRGERATAYVSFSGNEQPDGFWVRVAGTKAHAEANLFEPPRLTLRRVRPGEPASMRLVDGVIEARDVLIGSVGGFWRKLGGISSYDGLPEFIACTYQALESGGPPPVGLDEIDAVASLVDRFTAPDCVL